MGYKMRIFHRNCLNFRKMNNFWLNCVRVIQKLVNNEELDRKDRVQYVNNHKDVKVLYISTTKCENINGYHTAEMKLEVLQKI